MNFLILGDGPEERAWAAALANRVEHWLIAVYPGFADREEVIRPTDLEDALAVGGVEAVIVGGDFTFRAEALRRAAAEGLAVVVVHPPGPDSEAYYQVALSRAETGAVVVPDLPDRLHPAIAAVRDAYRTEALGSFRGLLYEVTAEVPDEVAERDLARVVFARAVDVMRSIVGDIEAVNATGDPPGLEPDLGLVVQLRVAGGRRIEVRIQSGVPSPARLTLTGVEGSLTAEWRPGQQGPARLIRRGPDGSESVAPVEAASPFDAILRVLGEATLGRPVHPDLLDATRATEVAEGVVRSLRRGRTVELHYEEISEEASFKGVMTSLGCLVLLSILVVVPIALAGPALGAPWTIYLAFVIPPALLLFLFLQLLRFAVQKPPPPSAPSDETNPTP